MATRRDSTAALDAGQLREEYDRRRTHAERLVINLQQALKSFLEQDGIPYLDVTFRVKEFGSFSEKIGRKSYSTPFEQCEDLCGLRVICYYPSDVDAVAALIRREFLVHSSIDKGALLGVQEFGYRSTHFVASVKPEWEAAPNYRGLGGLKAEIQVRTLLMHAWAEVEHKLAYKSEQQVPDEFRRRLGRLSAQFEEADAQFEDLRDRLRQYRASLAERAQASGRFDPAVGLSLDSLRALLDYYFPDRGTTPTRLAAIVLEEVAGFGLSMPHIVRAVENSRPYLAEYESLLRTNTADWVDGFNQAGALRASLDIAVPGFVEYRTGGAQLPNFMAVAIEALREEVAQVEVA